VDTLVQIYTMFMGAVLLGINKSFRERPWMRIGVIVFGVSLVGWGGLGFLGIVE
jgi:hypothetical protein